MTSPLRNGSQKSGREIAGLALLAALLIVTVSCGQSEAPADQDEPALELETVASGLVAPWAIAFTPDGRILVTERAGKVRVIENGRLRPEPWAEVDVVPPDYRSEGGLLGIAVAPDFTSTGYVFVVGTFVSAGELVNRVLRFTDRDGIGVDRTVLIDAFPGVRAEPGSEPAIHTHLGGAIAFGPDGMLWVTTGDLTQPELSQDPASLAGKVLRYNPDGTVPADNPTPSSPVYALGVRNSQGIAWHPDSLDPFITDHGPSDLSWERTFGGWFGDELNALVPGGNYGWPAVVGKGVLGRFIDPLVEWSPAVAPSGLTVYTGRRFPWQGNVLVTSLRAEHLWRVILERDTTARTGWRAVGQERLLEGAIGRIRAATMGPDGELYITSSNRDGRGKPREGDDRLYRVVH
jgi:aldose sugar dehydrogenase